MSQELKFESTSGAILDATLSEPEDSSAGSIVILTHGFQSSKESNTANLLEKKLNGLGIATLRFSFFGHGNSTGSFADITLTKGIQDIESAAHYVRDTLGYKHVSISGTSYGGATALLAAARISPQFDCVVLKCPVADYKNLEDTQHGKDGITEWIDRGYIEVTDHGADLPPRRLNASFYLDLEKNNGLREGAHLTSPTLIVHGENDEEVPVEQVQALSKELPHCQLKVIKGAGHRFDEGDSYQQMISLIVDFFKEQLT